MKKILAFSVLMNVALVVALGLSWKALNAHAAVGGDGIPVGNGDVNGDGAIDISDPVYLLSNMFLAGPAPVPIECPTPVAKGLPATGQTKCYDNSIGVWFGMPCDQATCKGQDAQYSAGCPRDGRFVDNGDGTVTDNCTGLMWQKDTADTNGSGSIEADTLTGDPLHWCEALAYCEDLSFAGHHDWRLPNVQELQSIVDYGRFDPAIDPVFGSLADIYWSSSSIVGKPVYAWLVIFGGGSVDGFGAKDGTPDGAPPGGYKFLVRAVRGGL